MKLSQSLWEKNLNLAKQSLQTKFVQGIKNGSLPKDKFKAYVAQDYYFLKSFSHAYGLAVSKCNDKKVLRVLSELLLGVSEELILHEGYSKELDIDLKTIKIETATREYTKFLYEVSTNNSLIEIICSMTPCMRLYSWIGCSLSNNIENNPYSEWIKTYSGEEFNTLANSLENLIDQDNKGNSINTLNFFYEKAMKLEVNFFNAYSNF